MVPATVFYFVTGYFIFDSMKAAIIMIQTAAFHVIACCAANRQRRFASAKIQ